MEYFIYGEEEGGFRQLTAVEAIFGIAYGTDSEDYMHIGTFLIQRRHTLRKIFGAFVDREFPFLKQSGRSFLAVVDNHARFLEDIDMIGAEGEKDDARDGIQPL